MAGLDRADSMKQTADIPSGLPLEPPSEPVPPAFDANALVAEGLKLHQAGRLDAAAAIYQRVLAVRPDHFDSRHLLGVIFHQCGHQAQALAQIEAALAVVPDNV